MTEQAAQDQIDPNMPQLDEEATEQTEATETEGQAETAPAEVEEKEGGFVETDNDNVQKRINKITAEKYAEKRRADELQKKIDEQSSVPTPQGAEPKLEDFDFDETAYMAALVEYKVKQQVSKQTADIQTRQSQSQAEVKAKQTQEKFHANAAKFTEKAPDYETVIAGVPQLPPDTLDAIMQSDNGPQLAYYLGKHLDVADEIAAANPIAAALKLGEISAQLAATTKTVKTSAAPAPIVPVGSGGSPSKSQEDMSMDEIYNM